MVFGLALIPRAALAHGEDILVIFFWEVAIVPWAVVSYLVARSQLVDGDDRARLAPFTLLSTLIAGVGGLCGIWALAEIVPDPTPLSPLMLIFSGAPAVWYLWRQRAYQWAVALLLIPLALTGTCAEFAMTVPSNPALNATRLRPAG
ncbi:MAG TPA: hypothetical protein VGP07_15020 [Polyangia bacterium]